MNNTSHPRATFIDNIFYWIFVSHMFIIATFWIWTALSCAPFWISFCQKKLRTTPQSKDGGGISYPCKVRWISLYNQPLKVSSLLNGSTLNFQIPCKKFLNCGIVKNTYWKHETKEVFLKFSLEIMYGGVFVIVFRDNKKSKNTGWITSLKGYPKHCL